MKNCTIIVLVVLLSISTIMFFKVNSQKSKIEEQSTKQSLGIQMETLFQLEHCLQNAKDIDGKNSIPETKRLIKELETLKDIVKNKKISEHTKSQIEQIFKKTKP